MPGNHRNPRPSPSTPSHHRVHDRLPLVRSTTPTRSERHPNLRPLPLPLPLPEGSGLSSRYLFLLGYARALACHSQPRSHTHGRTLAARFMAIRPPCWPRHEHARRHTARRPRLAHARAFHPRWHPSRCGCPARRHETEPRHGWRWRPHACVNVTRHSAIQAHVDCRSRGGPIKIQGCV